MTRVAFIGLGIMGRPMAVNLVEAGFTVIGYNRTAEKTAALVASGGRAAESVADAVHGADVVALMLPDTPDVLQVLEGPDGVLSNAKPGGLVIDFSTIRPDTARELSRTLADRGLRMLDAPVSGGEQGAIDGTLSIMVGGPAGTFRDALPVLNVVGKIVVHLGPAGAGQTVKAANQLMVAAHLQAAAEAIVFLEAQGIDPRRALPVLRGGLAGSAVLERKGESMISRQFKPGFRVALHHKDIGIMIAAARAAGTVTPLGALVAQLFLALTARGEGDLDHSALLGLTEELSGARHD